MTATFYGGVDLASVALWLFYLFFAGLVFWLQRENMREGYPLEDEHGNPSANQGPYPVPGDKTFKLPHGRGEVTVPSGQHPDRSDLALAPGASGDPLTPTGDPMLDGVGPASWAPRRDVPELDGHGHPKIVPMSKNEAFHVSAGRDPRGKAVMAGDGKSVGAISDMWIDEAEQMVRYLEVELDAKWGSGKRLIPMTFARIKADHVRVSAIYGKHFATVPQHASPTQVTLLEEDKISGYYGGGKLYADSRRLESQI